jgi:hypothetical protein
MSDKKPHITQENPHQAQESQQIRSKFAERLHNIRRKMSRGASEIVRMIRTRGGGHTPRDVQGKGHHKPGGGK